MVPIIDMYVHTQWESQTSPNSLTAGGLYRTRYSCGNDDITLNKWEQTGHNSSAAHIFLVKKKKKEDQQLDTFILGHLYLSLKTPEWRQLETMN